MKRGQATFFVDGVVRAVEKVACPHFSGMGGGWHHHTKRFRIQWWGAWFFIVVACLSPLDLAEAQDSEPHKAPPVVWLAGVPYELGRQHGVALRQEVRAAVTQVLGYFRQYLKVPVVRVWVTNWWLDTAWRQAQPFLHPDHLQELEGLADGSGVPLRDLMRLHAIPDRTYACSNLAAWGQATREGRLLHVRNLDWNIDAGIQQFATVFVVHPTGKHAFVNVGWAGFIGVLTGANDAQLSVGQVGAETTDATFRGEPMAFVIRRMLETSGGLEHATTLVRQAQRTVGVNYVIADAKARTARVVETTQHYLRVFEADDAAEHAVPYARPMPDAVFRADTAMDPTIRERQIASGGDPTRRGVEDPAGSSAYDVRYLGQAEGLTRHRGALDPLAAQEIARTVAPSSNIQSVIFAWPTMWVANAQGQTPAAQTTFYQFDLEELLGLDE